eukprot:11724964-Heterocapsa_arctica.AAC.1
MSMVSAHQNSASNCQLWPNTSTIVARSFAVIHCQPVLIPKCKPAGTPASKGGCSIRIQPGCCRPLSQSRHKLPSSLPFRILFTSAERGFNWWCSVVSSMMFTMV